MEEEYFNIGKVEQPSKGCCLISDPFLPDPNFERTVVLLCEHNEDGSFGFILNKPSILNFADVMDNADGFNSLLYVGGPVQQDTLHFIHKIPGLGGDKITEGIYWGGDFDQVMQMINNGTIDQSDFRFFLGYSGWSQGQLDEEIKENSWIVYQQPDIANIFDMESDILWKNILKGMGGKFRMFANYPIDPRLN